MAALAGREDIVQAMLSEYHCAVDGKDKDGWDVLHYACAGGHASLAQTLILQHQADVHI